MSKNIIVTGASRGIGYALVKQLLNEGHQVLALSRNIETIKILKAQHSNLHYIATDIGDVDDLALISDFVAKNWKKVDILVHNAGKLISKPFTETTMNDFLEVYKVNVFAVAELTRLLIKHLFNGSHVVTVSSMGGIQGSMKFPGLAAYSSSKGAVIILTELLAEEYKDTGIKFNALALGAVQTEMLAEAFPGYEAPTTAEEMANYITNFALTGSQFYNGKVLQVSASTP